MLVSADFSKELTSAVLWLNDKDLDICCVRIKPYAYEGKTLIDVQQVVPLPEAADYQVQVREKKRQERKVRRGTTDFTRYDVVVDGHTSTAQWKRNAILLVVKGIVSHGVSPEEITQVLQPIKGRQLFKVVLEETEDPERVQEPSHQSIRSERTRLRRPTLAYGPGRTVGSRGADLRTDESVG